jgi:hypothetical protein
VPLLSDLDAALMAANEVSRFAGFGFRQFIITDCCHIKLKTENGPRCVVGEDECG